MTIRLALVMIAAVAVLAACDNAPLRGIASLGKGFVQAFNQDRNDTPVDASAVELRLTPGIEPFNP